MIGLDQLKEGRPEMIETERAFLEMLLEGAVVSPFGAECCCVDGIPEYYAGPSQDHQNE